MSNSLVNLDFSARAEQLLKSDIVPFFPLTHLLDLKFFFFIQRKLLVSTIKTFTDFGTTHSLGKTFAVLLLALALLACAPPCVQIYILRPQFLELLLERKRVQFFEVVDHQAPKLLFFYQVKAGVTLAAFGTKRTVREALAIKLQTLGFLTGAAQRRFLALPGNFGLRLLPLLFIRGEACNGVILCQHLSSPLSRTAGVRVLRI